MHKKDLKNLVFKNKKKFEYFFIKEKLIILKICHKIFENFRKICKKYKKELHLMKEILFKY